MKNNRSAQIKTAIFLAPALFALTLLCQASVYGQIQPQKKAPVTPVSQPTPTPAKKTAVNPARQQPGPAITKAPVNPVTVPLPKAAKLPPPDLYIKDVKINVNDDSGSVLIANSGQGNAGGFKMVYELMSDQGSVFHTS